MAPKFAFLLALLGVIAAGLPLLWLTRPAPRPSRAEAVTPQVQQSPALVAVYTRVQYSGSPQVMRLSCGGELMAEWSTDGSSAEPGVWEPALKLPLPLQQLDLELEALWADADAPQAVTVTVEPERQPSRSETRWSLPGGMMYDTFSFTWP